MNKKLTTIVILLMFHINSFTQKNIKTNKLVSDFDFTVKNLQEMHQGLYKYEDRIITNKKIANLRSSIQKPMSKLAFYMVLQKLIAITNEGHTYISLPKATMIKAGLSKSFLPLSVKFCDKELIINQNYGKVIKGLQQGDKILSINGRSIKKITNKLFPLMVTDGFNKTSQYEWIGGINFSLLHRLVYGKTKNYIIEIENHQTKKIQKLNIPAIRFFNFKQKNAKFGKKKFRYNQFETTIINDSIAYLSIPNFHANLDYEEYYIKAFQKIKKNNIKHLILDIQANGGGTEGRENLLFSYLSDSVFSKYKAVTMLPKPYHINKKEKDYILDKWQLKGAFAKRGAYTLQSDYYSLKYQKPNKKLIYNEKLYVLISGKTFSGGAEIASLLKMTNRATFIGEETGGAYQGNVSGYSETIKLPNTKIKIEIPTVNFQINVNPQIKGRGIMPDYTIPETQNDYLNEQNSKLNFALKLITK